MAKASLKLTGIFDPWAKGVRIGQLTKSDGTEVRVLVRPLETWPAELVEPVREEARLVSRLDVAGVLRVEYASAVGGKPAIVHGFEAVASVARLRDEIVPRGQVFPARAALEIAAEVASILHRLAAASRPDTRFCQTQPTPSDVLIGVSGEVWLAGVRAMKATSPRSPVAPGYLPPPGGDDGGTYGVAALLFEMLAGIPLAPATTPAHAHDEMIRKSMMRIIGRPGDVPSDEVMQALRRALSSDPEVRGAPGELALRLREIAAASRSTPLRTWASALVPTIPGVLPMVNRPRREPAPEAPENTDDDMTLAQGSVLPRARPAPPRAPAGNRPLFGLPGPRPKVSAPRPAGPEIIGPPMLLATSTVRKAVQPSATPAGQPAPTAVTKSTPARAQETPTPPKPPGPGPTPGKPVAGPLPASPRPVAPRPEPAAAPIDRSPPIDRAPPPPPVRSAEAPARAPEPRPAADGPRISVPIGGLELPEGPPPRRRNDTILTVLLSAGLVGMIALLAVGFFLWKMFGATPDVEPVTEAPAPTAPLATPGEVAPAATAEEPVAAPAPAPVKATEPAAKPAEAAAKPTTKPTEPVAPATKPATKVETPDEDPGDVRITSSKPAVVEAPPAPAEPASPGPYRVEFRSGSDAVTSLEVRCKEGGGSGASVVVEATPAGACRVTGRGSDAPIVTQVNVSANRTYTCFSGGSRSCR